MDDLKELRVKLVTTWQLHLFRTLLRALNLTAIQVALLEARA
jgi:hypothetical protein